MAEAVIGRGMVEIVPDFKKFGKELAASMRTARAQLDGSAAGLKASAGTIFNSMAKVGKGTTLLGVGVAAASVKMAGDFQAETAVLQTAAGETAANLGKVRKGILSISEGTGTGIKNLTDGMYTIEKAGFRGADGLQVLKAAAQGAKEENAQLSDVTNAMTSVMASYHLKASDSVRVMNSLKTAAGEGKITMEEFSGALSTVLPIASANKISLAEVGGAVATLTQHGTSAREATQELASTIRNLAAPNNVATHEMARFGLSAQNVALNIGSTKRGLAGTIDLLTKTILTKMGPSGKVLLSAFNETKAGAQAANDMLSKMPKSLQSVAKEFLNGKISVGDWKSTLKGLPVDQANLAKQFATLVDKNRGFSDELKKGGPASKTYTEAIKKMSGGAIGLNTILQLSGESTDSYHERIKKIGESYSNTSKDVEGWKVTQGLFNTQLARMKQTMDVLLINLGTKLIPILQSMVTWFSHNKDVVIVLAGVIAGVLTLAVAAFAAKTVLSAGKVVVSFAKIGASAVMMGVNIVRGIASASAAASSTTGLAGSFGGAIRRAFNPSTYRTLLDGPRLRAMYMADGMRNAFRSVGSAASSMATTIKTAAVSAGSAAWSGITSGAKAVGTAMKTAALATRDFARAQYESIVANAKAAVAWTIAKAKTLAQAAATAIATAAQWLWNLAMDANPITLVIIAIAALVAAIIVIATKTTWFQTAWKVAWGAITTAFFASWNFIKDHWVLIVSILTGPIGAAVIYVVRHWKTISDGFNSMIAFIRDHWVAIVSIITGPIGAVTLYVLRHWGQILDGAKAMIKGLGSWFSGLPGRITKAVGDLSITLYKKGQNLINGLISGAKSALSGVGNWAKSVKDSIVNAIKHVFGIKSPSTVMAGLGGHMMAGLLRGLLRGKAVLNGAVKGLFHSPLDAAKNLLKNGVSLGGDWLSKIYGGTLGGKGNAPLGKGVQDAQNYAAELISEFWPGDFTTQMGSLRSLWNGESGWRWNAKNPSSGAYGIPQALPAGKMASAGSDWLTNPRTQIIWGLNYIRQRYGKPSTAYGDWLGHAPHWYDNGGWLPTGLSLAMNGTGRPERIRTAGQESALGGDTYIFNFNGPVGSQRELENWLVTSLDNIGRNHRVPASFKRNG